LEMAKKDLTTPGANCVGWGDIPELIGYDPLLRYMHTKLAWDPFLYDDWKTLLSEFVLRRYGTDAYENMYKSYLTFCDDLFDRRTHYDPYISSYKPVYRNHGYLAFSSVRDYWHLYADGQRTELLKQALDIALNESKRFEGDDLYEKYISGLFHSYITEMHKLALVRCYSAYAQATEAFNEGKDDQAAKYKEEFDKEARRTDMCLMCLEDVWGTRPELSTENNIKEAMNVPGASPLLAKTIRKDSGAFEEGAFETLVQWYRPVAKLIMKDLGQRLERGETKLFNSPVLLDFGGFNWQENPQKAAWREPRVLINDPVLRPEIEKVLAEYINGPIHIEPRFKGTTTAAVENALMQLTDAGCTVDVFSDMRTLEMISRNYPLAARKTRIIDGEFETPDLTNWQIDKSQNEGAKAAAEISPQAAKSGMSGLRLQCDGPAQMDLSQRISLASIKEPLLKAACCLQELPVCPGCVSFVLDGYDYTNQQVLHAVYWYGSANWDYTTGKPAENKTNFYTLNKRLETEKGKWVTIEQNIAADVDNTFGKNTFKELGIVEMVLRVRIWSNESYKIDTYIDDVSIGNSSQHVEKM
jgi:hypothetical protein